LITQANPQFGTKARQSNGSGIMYANRTPKRLKFALLSVFETVPHGTALTLFPIAEKLPISADMSFHRRSARRGKLRAINRHPGGH
jgi:hypothetical protein